MAYPTVSAPYGFKPVNLIGGQVYAGSTRNIPIQYSYATSIFYGDFVNVSSGTIVRLTPSSTTAKQTVGIFLGCSYTSPITKQKIFAQYWPGGTLAGDAVAIVADDPDIILKAAMVTASGGVIIGSASQALVGLNLTASDLAGNVNTGNSSNALITPTATPSTALCFRVIETVKESAVSTAVPSTSTTTVTITVPALTSPLVVGSEVNFVAANGQIVNTGSFLTASYAVGATSLVMNAASGVTIPNSAVLVITQYPEVLVKINFGIHDYYAA